MEEREEWTAAARVLILIPLDSGHRTVSDLYKLTTYIKITQLLLEDGDSVTAELYLSRAALKILDFPDQILQLTYKSCQARILDGKRDFLRAASKYYELSLTPDMSESQVNQCLRSAIMTAVLGEAGSARSRILATLYKDDRVRERNAVQSGGVLRILERMHLDRILKPEEVDAFSQVLEPHHRALLPGNQGTVLDRAVLEHNLLSASKVYVNIEFQELASLLNTSPKSAEDVAARMLEQGRMGGWIDQIEGILYFSDLNLSKDSPQGGMVGDRGTRENFWESKVPGLCNQLDSVNYSYPFSFGLHEPSLTLTSSSKFMFNSRLFLIFYLYEGFPPSRIRFWITSSN